MHTKHTVRGVPIGKSRMAGKLALFSLMVAMATGGDAVAVDTVAAGTVAVAAPASALSLNHFNHLYTDLDIDGKPMGLVHIYAKYPDYTFDVEPNEGYACVDDVARAIVMLTHAWRAQRQPELLRKIARLTQFVLHLQNRNGYFNNFLWGDLRINTAYRTSVAELNWWSLRALSSLEEAYPLLKDDAVLAGRIRAASARVVGNLTRDLPVGKHGTAVVAGVVVPTWLPAGSGADQAAQAIVALLPHYRRTANPAVRRLLVSLADGLLVMQKGDAKTYPYGMFLSWRNHWHAWGNDQAYALLMAGEALARPDYIAAALKEVDNFYPYLLKTGFAESIDIGREGAGYVEVARHTYPQIAYGVRPMIYAAMKAYALTNKETYRTLAADLGAWLSGSNDAATPIYDPNTGIVFDGIVAKTEVNRNAGAESTIEALLALQALKDGVQ